VLALRLSRASRYRQATQALSLHSMRELEPGSLRRRLVGQAEETHTRLMGPLNRKDLSMTTKLSERIDAEAEKNEARLWRELCEILDRAG